MNRRIKLMLIGAAATITVSSARANSLSLQESANSAVDQVYSLTVEHGKPSGNFEAGTQLVVKADDPPSGTQFVRWAGDIAILANPFLSQTTATVPSTAVKITATFTDPQTTNANSVETPATPTPTPAPSASSPSHSDQGWGG